MKRKFIKQGLAALAAIATILCVSGCSGPASEQSAAPMRTRHQLWMLKYPNTGEGRDFPLTGIENARPETQAAGRPRVDISKLPFDPYEFIKQVPEWNNIDMDREED